MKNPNQVADDYIQCRTTPSLKSGLQRAIDAHPDLKSMSHFMEEAAKALIAQHRRGETVAFPLEFLRAPEPVHDEDATKS